MSRQVSIAELNDVMRTTFLTGKVVWTQGIAGLTDEERSEVITKVREFGDFTPDNDPLGEHDFGAVEIEDIGKVYWKIDYYDANYRFHSPDPANPKVTHRVLTIMLASEY